MKAIYISPETEIIEVDVACQIPGSPGGGGNSAGGTDTGGGGSDEQDFSRTNSTDDIWDSQNDMW